VHLTAGFFIDFFDLITFENYYIDEFSCFLTATVLNYKKSGFDNFEDKAISWKRPCGSPQVQLCLIWPHTKMDSRPLYRRREARECGRIERDLSFEPQRMAGSLGWKKGE